MSFFGQLQTQYPARATPEQRQTRMAQILAQTGGSAPPTQFNQISPGEVDRRVQGVQDQQTFGRLMMASGDEALGGLGKTMATLDPEGHRAKLERQQQVVDYQQWQADSADKNRRIEVMLQDMKEHANQNQAMWRKIPSTKMTEYEADRWQVGNLKRFMGTAAPHMTQGFGQWLNTEGWTGPIERFPQWLNRFGFKVPEQFKTQAQWWADLEAQVL